MIINQNIFLSAFSAKNFAFGVYPERSRKTVKFLFFLLLFSSCAQVVPPGGGRIDKTPPKALKYIPDSAQLNFSARSIIINFDEYIQLRDLNTQLIISPPLEYTPDITAKGKTLLIELNKNETLKPNTTYAINFGNALQDFNENNPKENFRYIFSTGSYIDSLTVKGKVQNAFDRKTEKGLLVMLYSNHNDSVVYKKKPDYFAKTNSNGTFQINNVKNGKYKIVALKDVNTNYKYDGETESIGFVSTPIDISKKKNILIDLFEEPARKLYLKKAIHDTYGKFIFIFSKPITGISIDPVGYKFKDNDVFMDFSKNYDTLNFWFRNIDKDSLKLLVRDNRKIIDTVEFKLITKESALKSKKNPLKLKLVSSPNGSQNFDLNSELKLVFNNPIISSDKKGPVQLKADSVLQKEYKHLDYIYNFSTVKIQWLDTAKIPEDAIIQTPAALLNPKLKENTRYHLLILPGTFTDIFGLTNDSIKIDFKTREEKFYGSIVLKINIPETKENYIFQLLDERENIVRENTIKKSATLTYEYLYPKNYKLKIIYDTNSNGKWDSGNYIKKQQPEKVIYYQELINVRSNWDLDLDWKVNE